MNDFARAFEQMTLSLGRLAEAVRIVSPRLPVPVHKVKIKLKTKIKVKVKQWAASSTTPSS